MDRFFRNSNFNTLPASHLGIATLRQRLGEVLFEQIRKELPKLVREIDDKLSSCLSDLEKLGQPLSSVRDQKMFLMELSQDFQSLCRSAVDGLYDGDFFTEEVTVAAQEKRLRARVRNMQMDFAEEIRTRGSKWTVVSSTERKKLPSPACGGKWTREQAIDHVLKLLKSYRGQELPGLPSSRLVGAVFREYSSPWEQIARDHILEVWGAAKKFLQRAFDHLTTPKIRDALLRICVEPVMKDALVNANNKLNELLLVHKKEPMTTNHYFTDTAETLRQERVTASLEAKVRSLVANGRYLNETDIQNIVSAAKDPVEPDMDRAAAAAALDNMIAFYKVTPKHNLAIEKNRTTDIDRSQTAMKLFNDNVPNLVIEVAIIARLASIFQPKDVLCMEESVVHAIAAESLENQTRRQELSKLVEVLTKGAETCKEFASQEIAREPSSQLAHCSL